MGRPIKVYHRLAELLAQRANCLKSNNVKWLEKSTDSILAIVKEFLPSGAGFDSGTTIDLDRSNGDKLVFHTHFHHMHESGVYDGWTAHTVTITPSLWAGFHMKISGRDRNEVKEYIAQSFEYPLNQMIPMKEEG